MNIKVVCKDNEEISYVVINKACLEETAKIIATSFLSEPLVKAMDINMEEMLSLSKQICTFALEDGLSIAAINNKGLIVGAIISFDAKKEMPPISASHKFNPIFALLEEVDKDFSFNEPVLYQFMIGVNSIYNKMGIGRTLISLNNQLAKKRGFKTAKAAVTGPASQHIFSKLGYITVNSIPYKSFSFEGKNVFANIEDCEECKLVYKKL